MRHSINLKIAGIVVSLLFVNGCSYRSNIDESTRNLNLPQQWSVQSENDVSNSWISDFADEDLTALAIKAVAENHALKSTYYSVEIAKSSLANTNAAMLPSLDAKLSSSRRALANDSYSTNHSLDFSLSYDIDVWGKLSAQSKQAQLNLAAQIATYESSKSTLVANVSGAWFDVIEANKLVQLYKQRASNLSKNLAIIKRSYELGLGSALDVYLSQNNLHQEQARVHLQQQTLLVKTQTLQQFLSEYPNGNLNVPTQFPAFDLTVTAGIPSELILRRPDIQSAWLSLLSLDQGVAVAHRSRYPRLSISSSIGKSSDQFSDLLDGNNLLWSLIANVASPIFDAGRLKNLEQQAKIKLAQSEQNYLAKVKSAFAEVESLLNNANVLTNRYQLLQSAKLNAEEAEKLAFEQYQKGLVSYTTVLDAERRAFDAKTQLIQLQNQRIQNHISLHLALGGRFMANKNQSDLSSKS